MKFFQRLKKIREQKGFSQNQLAKAANLAPSAISQFESDLRQPSSEALVKLSKALDVTSDFLLGLNQKNDDKHSLPDEIKYDPDYLAVFRTMKDVPKDRLKEVEKLIKCIIPEIEEDDKPK